MSISISLVAVFIPLIFMGGILGRLFHEFAMAMTLAIAISAAVSLSLTPMLCGRYMRVRERPLGRFWGSVDRAMEAGFRGSLRFYARTLGWALRHQVFMLLVTVLTVVLTVRLYMSVPKGFLPLQDTGILVGSTQADRPTSRSPRWKTVSARWWTCCWLIRRWRRCRAGSASAPAGRR